VTIGDRCHFSGFRRRGSSLASAAYECVGQSRKHNLFDLDDLDYLLHHHLR